MGKAENALGGVFHRSPGASLLPVTDGSNCAETHVSQALIIYAVCFMLLSTIPRCCGAYILGVNGPRGDHAISSSFQSQGSVCEQRYEVSESQQQCRGMINDAEILSTWR